MWHICMYPNYMNNYVYAQVKCIGHFLFILSCSLKSLYKSNFKLNLYVLLTSSCLGKSCMILYNRFYLYAFKFFRLISTQVDPSSSYIQMLLLLLVLPLLMLFCFCWSFISYTRRRIYYFSPIYSTVLQNINNFYIKHELTAQQSVKWLICDITQYQNIAWLLQDGPDVSISEFLFISAVLTHKNNSMSCM